MQSVLCNVYYVIIIENYCVQLLVHVVMYCLHVSILETLSKIPKVIIKSNTGVVTLSG